PVHAGPGGPVVTCPVIACTVVTCTSAARTSVQGARPRRRRSGSEVGAHQLDEVDQAVGVAPLVVVPADDLDLVADHLGQAGVEDAGRRVGDDVGGDDRVLGVGEVALQRALLGGGLERLVDLLGGDLAGHRGGEVGGGAGRHRDAQRVAVELAVQLGQHEADGLGGAGGGRHDVHRGGAGAAQVLVRRVLQVLVLRVG